MQCQVCGTEMVEVVRQETLFTETRLHCPKRHAHGDIQGIPRQWRGPFAVSTMEVLNAQGKGTWSVKENREVPWPV